MHRIVVIFCLIMNLNGVWCLCESAYNTSKGQRFKSLQRDLIATMKCKPRILKFSPFNEDIRVDLDFNLPFLKVPVMQAKDAAMFFAKRMANVKATPFIIGAIAILGGLSLSSTVAKHNPIALLRTARSFMEFGELNLNNSLSNGDETLWSLFQIVDRNLLQTANIDIKSCMQKTLCVVVKTSSDNFNSGSASSWDKIISGVTSSEWFLFTIAGTSVKDAIDWGQNDINCEDKYKFCKFDGKLLHERATNLIEMLGEIF